jgi:hypothetical protein
MTCCIPSYKLKAIGKCTIELLNHFVSSFDAFLEIYIVHSLQGM